MAIWICEKMQSIIKPTPTSLGPVQRRGFGGGLALALGALTTAGQQVARVDGGRGRSPDEAWEATIKAGQDESLERRRGFCASRVTSSGLSAWSTSVLVSHRDDFCRSSTQSGEMA